MTRASAVYVSLSKAAVLLDVDARTVRRYIAAGYLDAGTLPGGAIRLYRAQVLHCVKPLPKGQTPS